jgi:NAD-dependent deacetylase
MRVAGESDVFIAIGTSLQVYPIAGALPVARAAGAKVVIVNAEPTAMDALADVVLADSISAVLPRVLGADRAHA